MNELNIQNIFQNYNEVVDIKALQTMLNISRSFAYDLIKKEIFFPNLECSSAQLRQMKMARRITPTVRICP